MNNYNTQSFPSQAKSTNIFRERFISRNRRAKRALWKLYKSDNVPIEYVDYLAHCPEKIANKLIDLMYRFALSGKQCFASTEWLANYIGVHTHSIRRVTAKLAQLGLIQKFYRGHNTTVNMQLNPILFKAHVRARLSYLFPILRKLAFNCINETGGFNIEFLITDPELCPNRDVTLKLLMDLNLFKSDHRPDREILSYSSSHAHTRETIPISNNFTQTEIDDERSSAYSDGRWSDGYSFTSDDFEFKSTAVCTDDDFEFKTDSTSITETIYRPYDFYNDPDFEFKCEPND